MKQLTGYDLFIYYSMLIVGFANWRDHKRIEKAQQKIGDVKEK